MSHLKMSSGCGLAELITARHSPNQTIIITQDIAQAYSITAELKFFSNNPSKVKIFPDWEVLPFDSFSPQNELINKRMEVLSSLLRNDNCIYVMSITTALVKIMPHSYFTTTEFNLKTGQSITYEELRYNLVSHGYTQVETVIEPGEFATRGSLIDLYPSDAELPYRLDLFGDEIESIKLFDPKSQRTIKAVNKIKMHGASEYPLAKNYINTFVTNWQKKFPEHKSNSILKDIKNGNPAGGAEFMLQLFFNKLGTIFDYSSDNTDVFLPENYSKLINKHLLHAQLRKDTCDTHNLPTLELEDVYLTLANFKSEIEKKNINIYNTKSNNNENCHSVAINISNPIDDLIKTCQLDDYRILISTNQETKNNYYKNKLKEANITNITNVTSWSDFLQDKHKICFVNSLLSHGCKILEKKIIIITESDLLSHEQQDHSFKTKEPRLKPELDLSQIQINDYVIHQDHGIGQYLGLSTISGTNDNNEYIKLAYANDDKLYIPVTDLDKIYSYRSVVEPELAKLGSKRWQNTKKKAIEKMVDSATELLDLYSQRNLAVAKQYLKPNKDYLDFAHEFPFTETPDQAKAIAEIIDSLTSNKLTDRLIIGDVGFGKTEIAMRAAFLAVNSKLQVVMIAPTTLLASQHYNTFIERFAKWPINIALYSGNITAKDAKQTETNIKSGKIDIIISTHKILSNKLEFKNLGLLLIDEEHRFGVKHKEKLKELKLDVDVISLTATPIPRTLQLACTKLRDLSIIASPPQERLPIKTYISTFDEKLIIEAVTREISRGGQVYYLYNEVAKINNMADYLKKLLPELSISIAHGQMSKAELTKAMTRFYNKQSHICLCSTIVESGIDIPNANTIIIDRADKLGLAQLHQIRGRVGRSSHQAYAYLFTPDEKFLTSEAKQRLEAISSNNTLGSGFQLAILDMEIRGAGELLGSEQSGHIKELGFDYYISLINEQAEALKNNTSIMENEQNISISSYFPTIIPDTYITNPAVRLNTYKRLASIKNDDDRFYLLNEIEDIYGKPPVSLRHLTQINLIKSQAKLCNIEQISISEDCTTLRLPANAKINTDALIELMTENPKMYKIKGTNIEIQHEIDEIEQKLDTIIHFISCILPIKTIEEIKE